MKKILVPTDFSKLSYEALDFATHLATLLKAEVSVVHFEEIPLDDTSLHLTGETNSGKISDDSLFIAQLYKANREKLNDLSRTFSEQNGVSVTGEQLGGGFLKGIQHYIKNHGADLVVMGTTGEESIQEFFTGNHTEQLIEHIDVPVLSVQHKVDKSIEDVVLGLDLLDEKYSKKAFEVVKKIMDSLKARLHIINIVDDRAPDSLMSDLNKIAKIAGLENYVVEVISDKNENEALMNYSKSVDAGLVIALSKAKSGLYRFFQHSFATKLTKASSVPVLTINKKQLV